MLNTIIKFLGGFTKEEKAIVDQLMESWRARAIASENSVALFKEIMTRDNQRYEKLEEKLMGRARYEPQDPPKMEPVGQSVSSWPRIKRELEKQSRVNENAEVSREKIEATIREGL
jgi:hypothetical protein